LDTGEFGKVLKSLNVKIIHLERRNMVKQVISWINSERLYKTTGDWNLYRESDRLPPLEVDLPDFATRLNLLEQGKLRLKRFVDKLGLPTIHIHYEDLLLNFKETMERVFKFLGVPFEETMSRVRKSASDDLRVAVSNFDSLKAQYVGTNYETMFDEVLKPTSFYSSDTKENQKRLKESARSSAREIVPLVLELIQPKRVIDIGCGPGIWLSVFNEFGIEDYLGIDVDTAAENILEIPPDKFVPFDFRNPLKLNREFDLVVTLEVAEHIPVLLSETFIDSITRLGPVVLFSAAIPLQGGANHLNEKWPQYWMHRFQKRGYQVIDCLRKRLWANRNVDPWYAQNILIFVRQDSIERYPLLQKELTHTKVSQLAKVHPKIYRQSSGEITSYAQWLDPTAVHTVRVEATNPIPDISPPMPIERLLCQLELEGEKQGTIQLPVCDGYVSGEVIADAIAEKYSWGILGRFFEHTLYPRLRIEQGPTGMSLWRGPLCLATLALKDGEGFWSQVHNQIGWTLFLQEIWDRPDWPLEYFYASQMLEGKAARCHDSNTPLTVEVSDDLPDVVSSGHKLDVVLTVGGVPLAGLTIPMNQSLLPAHNLRVELTKFSGFELCRVVVREALIGSPLTDVTPLRARLAERTKQFGGDAYDFALPASVTLPPYLAHNLKRASMPTGYSVVLGHRLTQPIGTSASRRAILPSGAASELINTARGNGEPVIEAQASGERISHIIYAPDLIDYSFLQTTAPGSEASSFSVALGRKADPARVTSQLPIFLYYRVTDEQSTLSDRFQVTREMFKRQLKCLHDANYYSVSLEDWRIAMASKKPLPGRAVLITFDGGYRDFQTHAWPLLKDYGFSATVFLTASEIGGVSQWYHECGENVPVLGWTALRQLQKEGVQFGSRSFSHYPLTALSVEDVVREGTRSRRILERGLDAKVDAFAYPYGDFDPAIQHLIGACGYVFGLSRRPNLSRFQDSLLALPRIEVGDGSEWQQFID
jgi:peptidoglycan/xylan/chitin deacetylase (PgdA/CDA1 family)/SAM-dependent methyltransferase